jgi:hypothetical protein
MVKSFIKNIWNRMVSNTAEAQPHFRTFGLVLIITLLGFYLINAATTYNNEYVIQKIICISKVN